MMRLTSDEIAARASGLNTGPWEAPTRRALEKLAPPDGPDRALLAAPSPIHLLSHVIGPAARARARQLKNPLRSHYTQGPISDPDEIAMRDDLDQALLQAQLYELAVQSSYIPVAAIRSAARNLLVGLLWSDPARDFLKTYEYPAVLMLAQRVEVRGLRAVRTPEPSDRPQDSVRFAAFLAHINEFYCDARVVAWTRFMDDYVVEPGEIGRFIRYMRDPKLSAPERANMMIEGALLFIASLSSAFQLLDKDQYACFGLPHAYWLQKFFGQLFTGPGDAFNPASRSMFNWSALFAEYLPLHTPHVQPEVAAFAATTLRNDITLLGEVFCAVKQVVVDARAAP